jgi:broad specificity phosphatase PhoE
LFSKILLIRHGRSAHVSNGAWLSREGVLQWRDAYDSAGIAPEESPPAAVLSAVARCDIIVNSDLPRALESAQRLATGRTAAFLAVTLLWTQAAVFAFRWLWLRLVRNDASKL